MQQKVSWIKDHIMDVLIWGLIGFFALLYVSLIFNYNIWTDEAFTLQLIHGNIKEITMGTAEDVHPPLYYYFCKLFFDITNESLWVQKFLTIIPQVGTYALIATVFRKKFGDVATFLSLIFFACIPCTMEFSVQVRMYSLALFFVTLCGVFAYEAYADNTKRAWVWLVVGALGAAYTHYFAFVSIIVIVGFLFLAVVFTKREMIKPWTISVICMLVGYLPWMKYFVYQVTRVRENYWISEITPEVVWDYFIWTFDLTMIPGVVYSVLVFLVFAGIMAITNIVQTKDKEDIVALVAMLVPTMTAILGVVISLSKSPIYRDQYVFPSLMMLAVFFGIAMRNVDKKLLVPICIFFLFLGAVQYRECFRQEYRSTYVPQTMEFFEQNLGPNDYVVYNWKEFRFIYENYFPTEQLIYLNDFDFGQDFDAVWFLNSQWFDQVDLTKLQENGLTMDIIGRYGIEHNEFDLYMIYRNEYAE